MNALTAHDIFYLTRCMVIVVFCRRNEETNANMRDPGGVMRYPRETRTFDSCNPAPFTPSPPVRCSLRSRRFGGIVAGVFEFVSTIVFHRGRDQLTSGSHIRHVLLVPFFMRARDACVTLT